VSKHRAVLLIRGINVGSSRKLPMADLRALCTELGCSDVTTYIQSGNVVVDTELTDAALSRGVAAGIDEQFGFRPAVMVRRPAALELIVSSQPFGPAAVEHLHVGFLSAKPPQRALRSLQEFDYAPEEFAVLNRELYLHLPGGVGRSTLLAKVPFADLLGGVDVTLRNWRTVTKLLDLATA
jgi:uncharacterized protein (DUF1697 family)